MSAGSPGFKAGTAEDGLRIRVRISPDELLFQPLQACATSKERSRLLLSLALQGYLVQTGSMQGGSHLPALTRLPGRVVAAGERLASSPEPRAEDAAAAVAHAPGLPGSQQSPQGLPVGELSSTFGGFLVDEMFAEKAK